MVADVSVRPSNSLTSPLFSATKIRPSGAKRIAVGSVSPVMTALSWKPDGTAAPAGAAAVSGASVAVMRATTSAAVRFRIRVLRIEALPPFPS